MANKINIAYRIGRSGCAFFTWILGPVEAINKENIPDEGPVCIMPNHVSYLDPPVAGCLLKRKVYFMAKAELFKVPVLGPMIASFGAFPVKRGVADRRALARAMELLRDGEVVNIFPEGRRSKDGEIGEANRGSIDLALKCNATIIPTLILGTEHSLSTINSGLHKHSIKIIYGNPLDVKKYDGLEKNEILENLSKDWKNSLIKMKEKYKD